MPEIIFELKNYSNKSGHLVQERVIVQSGETTPKFDRFVGTVGLPINTPFGPDVEKVEFPIPADSLSKAFEKFDETAKAFIKKIKEAARKEMIEQSTQKPGLILPGH